MPRTPGTTITVIGIDISKNAVHAAGLNSKGAIMLRQRWPRDQVEARLANIPPCLIGMEAGAGAHHLARRAKAPAVLAGCEAFTDIDRFGQEKLSLLRRFLPFRDGTPAHDRLVEIFAALDAEKFQSCFVSWISAQTGAPADVIAIDGKMSRRSYRKKGAKEAIDMVSAFATRQRLVLGKPRWRKNRTRLSPNGYPLHTHSPRGGVGYSSNS